MTEPRDLRSTVEPYSATGYPLSFLLPGQTGSILYNYETETWGARISEAYRGKYLDSAGGNCRTARMS